ncbi:hypothetical protein Tco_0234152 [Tanacetum coccineum]
METTTYIALVSCVGLGGYDWSDQAEEGPNYVLMAYSSSSSDSEVSVTPPNLSMQQNVEYPRALLYGSITQDMRTTTKRVV